MREVELIIRVGRCKYTLGSLQVVGKNRPQLGFRLNIFKMMASLSIGFFPLLLVLCTVSIVNAVKPCPLLGPIYPPPRDLSHDTAFNSALQNITSSIQDAVNAGHLSSDSISMQIFDASDSGSLLSLSYTADSINTTLGVNQVDENTVFRIGSTSKLWTMLLLLIENGSVSLDDPIARYIPELRQAVFELSRNSTMARDGIDFTKWNEVTLGELASHLSGISRDCKCHSLF